MLHQESFEHDVFICYNTSDSHEASCIADGLAKHGLIVWFDKTHITGHSDIPTILKEALKRSRIIVYIISDAVSNWAPIEFGHFFTRETKLEDCVVPLQIKSGRPLPPPLKDISIVEIPSLTQIESLVGRCRDLLRKSLSSTRSNPSPNSPESLTSSKINRLSRFSSPRDPRQIVLLGGVYLDIHLRYVNVQMLTPDEFSSDQELEMDLGGSALLVGRALARRFNKAPKLLSSVCTRNPSALSHLFWSLMDKETWVNPELLVKADSNVANTVIAHQLNRKFSTMFTNRGSIAGITWDIVKTTPDLTVYNPGVLHISSFFKTRLYLEFASNLSDFFQSIVIVDHGRFSGDINKTAIKALHGAFGRGLVDVYICTLHELLDMVSYLDQSRWQIVGDITTFLQMVADRESLLPFVTYVKCKLPAPADFAPRYDVYCIIGRSIHKLQANSLAMAPRRGHNIGFKELFNAAFVEAISRVGPTPAGSIQQCFLDVGQYAFEQASRS